MTELHVRSGETADPEPAIAPAAALPGASTAPATEPSALPDRMLQYRNAGLPSRLLRRAPVTIQLAIPYAVLIVPQAMLNDNDQIGFILGIFALGLAGALLVESFARPAHPVEDLARSHRILQSYGPALRTVALIACATGQLSAVAAAAGGAGTVATQVGINRSVSPLTPVFQLFASWTYSGAALLVCAYLAGALSKRGFNLCLLALVPLECVRAFVTTITATLMSLCVYLMVLALFAGTLKLRHCVAAVLIVLLVWPTIFELRNEIRRDTGIQVTQRIDAYERLRYDQQIARAATIPEVPIEIGQPGPAEFLRYGLIPRALDPDRPTLSVGSRISVFLGSSENTAYSFLPVTTAYVLEGPWSTVGFYAVLALIVFVAVRGGTRLTPVRLVVFGLVASGPLGWFATYPETSIAAIQGVVAALPLIGLLALNRIRRSVRPPISSGDSRSQCPPQIT